MNVKNQLPDLSVSIGNIKMKNPVTVASGTFGYGQEYSDLIDVSKLGAITVKGIMLKEWNGNPTPRIYEVPGGLLNSIGLQGPGIDKFKSEYMPFLRSLGIPVIVNIWGQEFDDYLKVAELLSDVDGVDGLEVNISCPNLKKGGLAFGVDPKSAAELVSAVRARTNTTIITKLAPNVPQISVFARAVEDAGSDAISLINTIPAMAIDINSKKPVLANIVGGLSGPAIHHIAVKLIWDAYKSVNIPIIGMGGITSAETAIELMLAGASAVAVGTANFVEPETFLNVISGIKEYLIKNNLDSVNDIVGSVDIPEKA